MPGSRTNSILEPTPVRYSVLLHNCYRAQAFSGAQCRVSCYLANFGSTLKNRRYF